MALQREVRAGKVYCKYCDTWKSKDDFQRDCTRPLGIKYKCKKCKSEDRKKAPKRKKCSRCKITKDFSEFSKKPGTVDGYNPACQPCLGYSQQTGHLTMATPLMAKMLTSAWNKDIMF